MNPNVTLHGMFNVTSPDDVNMTLCDLTNRPLKEHEVCSKTHTLLGYLPKHVVL